MYCMCIYVCHICNAMYVCMYIYELSTNKCSYILYMYACMYECTVSMFIFMYVTLFILMVGRCGRTPDRMCTSPRGTSPRWSTWTVTTWLVPSEEDSLPSGGRFNPVRSTLSWAGFIYYILCICKIYLFILLCFLCGRGDIHSIYSVVVVKDKPFKSKIIGNRATIY